MKVSHRIVRALHDMVPSRQQMHARMLFCRARALRYAGDRVRCPCCGGNFGQFLQVGQPPRPAACPRCDSRERQRLLWLYLENRTNFFSAALRVLHFAPEDCFQAKFRSMPNLDYLSADLISTSAMVAMDITRIAYPDGGFDVILCSHVLEHVPDDRKAIGELYRVLQPGGWAILQVPIDWTREKSLEDPAVTDPCERLRLFGQSDHVRVYGPDYPDRLKAAGFHVEVSDYVASFLSSEIERMGLDASEKMFVCRKPTFGPMEAGARPA